MCPRFTAERAIKVFEIDYGATANHPIESTFFTVRLRTKATKAPGLRGLVVVYKLIKAAQELTTSPRTPLQEGRKIGEWRYCGRASPRSLVA